MEMEYLFSPMELNLKDFGIIIIYKVLPKSTTIMEITMRATSICPRNQEKEYINGMEKKKEKFNIRVNLRKTILMGLP